MSVNRGGGKRLPGKKGTLERTRKPSRRRRAAVRPDGTRWGKYPPSREKEEAGGSRLMAWRGDGHEGDGGVEGSHRDVARGWTVSPRSSGRRYGRSEDRSVDVVSSRLFLTSSR